VVEFRTGSKEGPLLASVEVKPTGGWEKWVEVGAAAAPSAETTDVFAVFVNPGKSGLVNLDWVQFEKQ
jgi:cytochrome c